MGATYGHTAETFDLLYESATGVDWRAVSDGNRPDLLRLIGRVATALELPGDFRPEALEAPVRALGRFKEELEKASTVAIYGAAFARRLCHAIFGYDLRLTVVQGKPVRRKFLIVGETGAGKELLAGLIAKTLNAWQNGSTHESPYEPLNAATLSDTLLESQLFGHTRGAFTGAATNHRGLLVTLKNGGVLFLDEIDKASGAVQGKLLRVLETGEFKPLGGEGEKPCDFSGSWPQAFSQS